MKRYEFLPSMVIVSGPPLHGKSSVAALLVSMSNLMLFDVDVVREDLYRDKVRSEGPGAPKVPIEMAYEEMVKRAVAAVRGGSAAILAATFSRALFKAPLYQAFEDLEASVPKRIFRLDVTSRDEIKRRIASRLASDDPSPVRSEERYLSSLMLVEPWWPGAPIVEIDAVQPVSSIADEILAECRPFSRSV